MVTNKIDLYGILTLVIHFVTDGGEMQHHIYGRFDIKFNYLLKFDLGQVFSFPPPDYLQCARAYYSYEQFHLVCLAFPRVGVK